VARWPALCSGSVDDLQVRGMRVFRSILPFLIISVLCVGAVELFYRLALHALFRPLLISKETGAAGRKPDGSKEKAEKPRNYQIILDRNLFGTGGLETDDGKSNSIAGLSATSLDIILLGTIVGENEDKRAIVMDRESKKQEIYHVGDRIQGVIIKEILRGKIILGFRDRDEILDMTEARQYFAETLALPPTPQEQKILPAPEEKIIQQARPLGTGRQFVPNLRKFSNNSGIK
jgi:type II secretory pathway component PulC